MKISNTKIDEKYHKYLEMLDKSAILIQIKSDLLDRYNTISILELEILSNNIYDFCCLMANNLSELEISHYISYKNNCYYEELSESDKKKLVTPDYKSLTTLTKKYIKLIKSNLRN